MIPSVRQSSRTSAFVVYGGYYIAFYLPFDKELLRYLQRADVRRAQTSIGETVKIPSLAYRYARRVAFNAILKHRADMRLPAPPAPKWKQPVQLVLSFR